MARRTTADDLAFIRDRDILSIGDLSGRVDAMSRALPLDAQSRKFGKMRDSIGRVVLVLLNWATRSHSEFPDCVLHRALRAVETVGDANTAVLRHFDTVEMLVKALEKALAKPLRRSTVAKHALDVVAAMVVGGGDALAMEFVDTRLLPSVTRALKSDDAAVMHAALVVVQALAKSGDDVRRRLNEARDAKGNSLQHVIETVCLLRAATQGNKARRLSTDALAELRKLGSPEAPTATAAAGATIEPQNPSPTTTSTLTRAATS